MSDIYVTILLFVIFTRKIINILYILLPVYEKQQEQQYM